MSISDLGNTNRKVKLTVLHTMYRGEDYLPDKHCAMLLTYCCKGGITIAAADKEYSLTPGWFLLSNACEKLHVTVSDERSQYYILEGCFDTEGIDMLEALDAASYSPYALVFQSSDIYVRFDTEENRLLLTLAELANEFANREQANQRLIALLFETLLIKLERAVQTHGRASGFSYVAEAKQYIRSNLSSALTVQSVADHIGIHRSYLMRIFRQQTRMSVNQYINRMRVTQATVLLSDSSMSITEIAFTVGFNSRQNFYVVFEKLIGCSPSKYRISHGAKKKGKKEKGPNTIRDWPDIETIHLFVDCDSGEGIP